MLKNKKNVWSFGVVTPKLTIQFHIHQAMLKRTCNPFDFRHPFALATVIHSMFSASLCIKFRNARSGKRERELV